MAERRTVKREQPKTDAATELALHVKHRPKVLADVLGQAAVVRSLEAALASRTRPHCFLFTGPAGTGKTSLARILGDMVGVPPAGIIEVDAATHTGVDDMRRITETLRYTGFGDKPNKIVIVNECQRLSAGAWESLLMSTEEPPAHVYWAFTSTNPAKVPKAMVTRCTTYELKALRYDDIMDILERVCEVEKFDTPEWVLKKVAAAADGSMRAALTLLAKVFQEDDEDAVDELLSKPFENEEIIAVCQLMMSGKLSWPRLTETLRALKDTESPEGIRIVVCAYLSSCLMGEKVSDNRAQDILDMLAPFTREFDPLVARAALLNAFGRAIFG